MQAAYFPSTMAAREARQEGGGREGGGGSARADRERAVRIVTGQRAGRRKKERERERNMSCSLYLRRSHVISAVIGLGYRYVCIMPR